MTSGNTPSLSSTVPDAKQDVVPGSANGANAQTAKPDPSLPALRTSLNQYAGKQVSEIRYVGVDFDKSDKLLDELTQKQGEALDVDKVRQMTRRLYATGRYRTIAVRVEPSATGLVLIFAGVPRFYIGRVQVTGVKTDRLASLIEYGTQLDPGTSYTNAKLTAATENVKSVLASNGYYEPKIAVSTTRDDAGQQVNVSYTVDTGPEAKVGKVILVGTMPGITEDQFYKQTKLRTRFFHHSPKVDRDTVSTALSGIRAYYQKGNRLEATATLQKSQYQPATKTLDYTFQVEQGPVVKVEVAGAKVSKSRLKLLVPVYEEGTVDNDLLNEGSHNIKDFEQQQGYFNAVVGVKLQGPGTGTEDIVYTVDKGPAHKVLSVSVEGNKYFTSDLLIQSLKVQKADLYERSGKFSQALLTEDQNSIQAVYRANGFSAAKVTAKVVDSDVDKNGKASKVDNIRVTYHIDEGEQQTFGKVESKGIDPAREALLQPLLQARPGQPFSLVALSGDRDVLLSYYLSNGFDQATVEVGQTVNPDDNTQTDVSFNVTEGPQVFIGKVLGSGIVHTKEKTVADQILVHPGDPLDQSSLLETQRNLYNLALFNEVIAVVQNPTGDAELKNVLLQATEAKRWDLTYGFGFEAQIGQPGCGQYCTQTGTTAAQEGQAGVSPRVSLDVSRINLFGTDESLTLHTDYGLLEKVAVLTFQNPALLGNKKFAFQVSGGYSNVQDITTFKSSKLQGDFRVTHKATKKDSFVYDFQYRRVAVDPNSLAIASDLIPLLSEPVTVGGPGITWFHDTRTPSPLDAIKGSYTSVDEFLASKYFGSDTSFNRLDVSNSTYYQFGKGQAKYVFARNTRVGFIGFFGANPNVGVATCQGTLLNNNASCNPVPLPERLYAGGATSHRGFPINGAGPRDLQTGFPVGGSGVLVNTFELRLPPPVLPYVGDSVSFVLFHDMGNVFQHQGDIFKSIRNFSQPNQQTCHQVLNTNIGNCDFRYYSHAVGIGARYKTPVGPIRVDLSYNLNPPIYPVIPTRDTNGNYLNGVQPYVGQGRHFGFFFSIGQSF